MARFSRSLLLFALHAGSMLDDARRYLKTAINSMHQEHRSRYPLRSPKSHTTNCVFNFSECGNGFISTTSQ